MLFYAILKSFACDTAYIKTAIFFECFFTICIDFGQSVTFLIRLYIIDCRQNFINIFLRISNKKSVNSRFGLNDYICIVCFGIFFPLKQIAIVKLYGIVKNFLPCFCGIFKSFKIFL